MFSLLQKLKDRNAADSITRGNRTGRIPVRDLLLTKEMQELMTCGLPACSVRLPNVDVFHEFHLDVTPSTGFWAGGTFDFYVSVPLEYNMLPPKVTCMTKIWHPNIAENGDVCLSLLRETSLDEMGWAPTRTLKDVAYGVCALFDELLNFDDPLNTEAAAQYKTDKHQFIKKASEYTAKYAMKR